MESEQQHESLLDSSNFTEPTESRNRKSTYHGLTRAAFDERYGRIPDENTSSGDCTSWFTSNNVLRWLTNRVPVISLFRTYKFRKYILGDIVSGLSVGVITIPQSLGYARLAGVPIVLGLYTSFFPVLIYFVFGSSRHVSMGIMALCSLIIAEAVRKETSTGMEIFIINNNNNSSDYVHHDFGGFTPLEHMQISVAISTSFLAGIFLVLMSFLRLGFLVSYMAEPFVSGYLAASNLRVLTHQVRDCLGVLRASSSSKYGKYSGPGEYFYYVFRICADLANTNLLQLLISVSSLVTLVLVKKCINERFSKKLKVPIPIDMILVIVFTAASYYGEFEKKFNVTVVKTIPNGMPSITIPSVGHMRNYVFDSFMLAIVAYMMVAMMAKLFGQRHNYTVSNNQELFANGLCCVGGAFFCSMAGSPSPPRCFLMEATGGFTQVAYLISAGLALLTILVIAPLFQALPICVLSCVIIVACIPLFPHYVAWMAYWKTNKYDFTIWVVTAACNIIFPVDVGLLIGMGFSLVLVHFRMQRPQTSKLSINEEDKIYLDGERYTECHSQDGVVVFRFESPIYFATLDVFQEKLFTSTIALSYLRSSAAAKAKKNACLSEVKVDLPVERAMDHESGHPTTACDKETASLRDIIAGSNDVLNEPNGCLELKDGENVSVEDETRSASARLKRIVVDCSAVPFLDTSGAKILAQLNDEYSKFGIDFILAQCCSDVVEQLKRVEQCKKLVSEFLYPSLQDAFIASNSNM